MLFGSKHPMTLGGRVGVRAAPCVVVALLVLWAVVVLAGPIPIMVDDRLVAIVPGQPTVLGPPVEIIPLNDRVDLRASFQSHNQKIVSNKDGIWTAYLESANASFSANRWRFVTSADGGELFSSVAVGTNSTTSPTLETDSDNNVFLMHSDWLSPGEPSFLYRFRQGDPQSPQLLATIPRGGALKNATYLDEERDVIYHAAEITNFTMWFHVIGTDGVLHRSFPIEVNDGGAGAHYPHFAMENGTLYFAWTTNIRGRFDYHSIHVMKSTDGGASFQKLDGTPLSLPLVTNEHGPTDRITPDSHLAPSTWLWNLTVKNGRLYFSYLVAGAPPLNYQRMLVVDANTGEHLHDHGPGWKGDRVVLQSLDGFCATHKDSADPRVYCMARTNSLNRIGVIMTKDGGASWSDVALSELFSDSVYVYALGGARHITDDGYMIGSFTDINEEPPKLRFVKAKVTGIDGQERYRQTSKP